MKSIFDSWLVVITKIHKIPVVQRVWALVLVFALYGFFVDWFETSTIKASYILRASSSLYGSLITGLLLVFRTNSAYDRWWEGRKLWGQLVNELRMIGYDIRTFLNPNYEQKLEFESLLNQYAIDLKDHLREPNKTSNLTESYQNKPLMVLDKLRAKIYEHHTNFKANEDLIFDNHLTSLINILGACERIKSSPLSTSYRALLKHGIILNLVGLPWYLSPSFHGWSIPLIIIASYFMLGIELVAEDVEQPFKNSGDGLELDKICETVKKSLKLVFYD